MSVPIRVRKLRHPKTRPERRRPWQVSFGSGVAAFPTGADALDFVRRLIKAAA